MKEILLISKREIQLLCKKPIYALTMIVLPIIVALFFTTVMADGQPQEMPVGVVDLDNTSTTRSIISRLDAFQTSHVVAHYPSVADARRAMQHDEIYAFLYLPKGTTEGMLSQRQPHVSFYYSSTSLTAGSLLFRDLKTITTLGGAAVGQATMRAKGLTDGQIQSFLQPITVDVHTIGNPWVNYNVYLSTMLIPGCMLLFIMLLTAYSLGMELKHGTSEELLKVAGGNILKALIGKMIPQFCIFFLVMMLHMTYLFSYLNFPHPGGYVEITLLAAVAVLAAQGFGICSFALFPNVRMAMSICSLWGVLSFSMVGAAYPAFAMDKPLEALSWLFPLRHYFMIYAGNIFNGQALDSTYIHWAILIILACAPMLMLRKIHKVYTTYTYIR